MKKLNLFLVVVLLATVIFTACDKDNEPSENSPEKIGILINGVIWSPYNVGVTSKFVSNPEDFGGYYQWNRKDTTDFVLYDAYNQSYEPSSWLSNNNPCPKDWRVPTLDELNKLLDTEKVTSEWTTENNINGYRFVDKSSGKSIFLPAAGYINCYSGFLGDVGYYGNYWSSTSDGTNAHLLDFQGTDVRPYCTIGYREGGFSVRPVSK